MTNSEKPNLFSLRGDSKVYICDEKSFDNDSQQDKINHAIKGIVTNDLVPGTPVSPKLANDEKYRMPPMKMKGMKNNFHISPAAMSKLTKIDVDTAEVLKNIAGYKLARTIILESELSYDENIKFINKFDPDDGKGLQRIFDTKIGHEFVYDPVTGARAWIESYKSEDGDVLKEFYHRTEAPTS
jgi:hypothetical protein